MASKKQDRTEDRSSTAEIVGRYVHSYSTKGASVSDADWLACELARDGIHEEDVTGILDGFKNYQKSREELLSRLKNGESRARFIRDCLTAGAKASGISSICDYAARVDAHISNANQMMWDSVHNKDGSINQSSNLNGFIEEAYLAGTADINYGAMESPLTVVQLRVTDPNSPDTQVIDTTSGEIVSQQQMKFCQTSGETVSDYKRGDYNGQTLIAPAEQVSQIREQHPEIDVQDHIGPGKSSTFAHSKEMQRQVQEDGHVPQFSWKDADVAILSKHIVGKAVKAGVLSIGIQAAATLGRRMWNAFVGKPNKAFEQDLTQLAEDAAKSGMAAGATTAVAGGLVVAARRSNLLGSALAKASPGTISALACMAVENVKILNKLGKGEITPSQALNQSGDNTCALLGSLTMGADFAVKGTALLPGVGTVVGALVGGAIGHMGGHAIYEGAKRAVKAVGNFISRAASSVKSSVSRAWSAVKSWFA